MCISAPVSFGLSGLLTLTGVYCLARAARDNTRLIPLALVPFFFSAQQFCEGWVWLGITRSDPRLAHVAAMAFLFFALFFWPLWIPLSTLLMEPRQRARRILRAITLAGLLVGLGLYMPILTHPQWLSVELAHHSIRYDTTASRILVWIPDTLWELLYLALVSIPLFVSPVWRTLHFGLALVLAAALSRILFFFAFASIWCFFAAALSLYLGALFFALPRRPAPAVAA